ncbi:MAG TPA: DUF4238 domain-containing protein, partial [Longimicrobium sp.]|nr:DUF4238 domain-containing protein [Longimicrobium sp.]
WGEAMHTANPTRLNHFVQRAYLGRWADRGQTVQEYKIVVPSDSYPEWRPLPIRSAGSMRDLYSVEHPDLDLDHYEKWLNEYVEQPAQEVLEKVTAERALTRQDLEHLVRYAFAQSVRTPKDYISYQQKTSEIVPDLLANSLKRAVRMKASLVGAPPSAGPVDEALPLTVTREPVASGQVAVRAEFTVGTGSWLASRKRMIREYPPRFLHHRWQVLRAHESTEWFTTDHPVLRLGYLADQPHGFEAGWMQRGADIIMPLSPRHLLHTQVGSAHRNPPELSAAKTFEMQALLAQNARRSIYARVPIPRVRWFRERVVNVEAFEEERKLWG